MNENIQVKEGQIYLHFKHELDFIQDKSTILKYLYKIICIGYHSETKEKMVVYRNIVTDKICIRPYDMFISDVDKIKYPDVKQKERFKLFNFDSDIEYYLNKNIF